MKKVFLIAVVAVVFFAFNTKEGYAGIATPVVDSLPAEMKKYWLVMLFKGSNKTMDKATSARIQAAHLANIDRLWQEGKVVMAGPMGYNHDADLRGIFIMDAKDSVTAASYVNTDSAVIVNRLRFELHPWWTQKGTYIFK